MESWRNLADLGVGMWTWAIGDIASTWLPFFLTLRLLSHPDCASMIMNYDNMISY
jgi:hypothetical protein